MKSSTILRGAVWAVAAIAISACDRSAPVAAPAPKPPAISITIAPATIPATIAATPPIAPEPTTATAAAIEPPRITLVYHQDFTTPPGPEWSSTSISKTAKGDLPYLGDIGPRQPLTLSLAKLPPHDLIRITFDLYILGGWSGSSTTFGYSRWDMNTGDGRNLIHTTFCNWGGAYIDNNEQSFPDSYGTRPHPAFTLATEKQTLGMFMNTVQGNEYDASSAYHMVLTFPHTDKDILFEFHSMEQGMKKKYFGLANLSVETLPALPPQTDAQLAALWKNLADADPATFFKAQWDLIASGDQAVEYITKHLDENADLTPEEITKLIKQLESDDLPNADEVAHKITFQGHNAILLLRNALANDPDLSDDAKTRLEDARVLSKQYNESPSELRLQRTKHLLAVIHTKAALALNPKIPELQPRNLDTN